MIALGVVAAVWLFGRRLEERASAPATTRRAIALWAVLAGVIGARLYHVITDWQRFDGRPRSTSSRSGRAASASRAAWSLGIAVGLWVARRRGMPLRRRADVRRARAAAGPGDRPVGQLVQPGAVRPADRPAVGAGDRRRAPARRATASGTTFHPTFLYESLWYLVLCGVLLWIDKRGHRLRPGRLFAMYVAGYTFGRFWIERLRIDPANEIWGCGSTSG